MTKSMPTQRLDLILFNHLQCKLVLNFTEKFLNQNFYLIFSRD